MISISVALIASAMELYLRESGAKVLALSDRTDNVPSMEVSLQGLPRCFLASFFLHWLSKVALLCLHLRKILERQLTLINF